MRPRSELLLVAAALACLQAGCGTVTNLSATPGPPIPYADVWLVPPTNIKIDSTADYCEIENAFLREARASGGVKCVNFGTWLAPRRMLYQDMEDPNTLQGECWAFGGITRSLSFANTFLVGGLTPDFEHVGEGRLLEMAIMTALGSVALGVDAPLSLVGDVVSLPVVYARQHEAPWATWWGEQVFRPSPNKEPAPQVSNPFVELDVLDAAAKKGEAR
jgi:hypothetical protein